MYYYSSAYYYFFVVVVVVVLFILRRLLELEFYVKAFRRLGYNQMCKVQFRDLLVPLGLSPISQAFFFEVQHIKKPAKLHNICIENFFLFGSKGNGMNRRNYVGACRQMDGRICFYGCSL